MGPPPHLAPVLLDGISAGTVALDVVPKPGLAIAGRVVDRDGHPVTGVRVDMRTPRIDGPDEETGIMWTGVFDGPVDADGRFRVDGLPEGRFRIVLFEDNGDASSAQIRDGAVVRAGETDLKLVTPEDTTISGVVTDEHDVPWIVHVELIPVTGGPSQMAYAQKEGRFRFIGLDPTQRYRLVVLQPGLAPAKADDVAPGTQDVRLRLFTGLQVQGRVLAADGSPLAKAFVRLRRQGVDNQPTVQADAEGKFFAQGLVDGEYAVDVSVAGKSEDSIRDWRECGTIRAGDKDVELRTTK